MNYLVGYGAAEQPPAGFLDKIKSWWSGIGTTEKVVYAVGGAAVVAGVAMVALGGKKKSYKANKSRKRRMKANEKRGTAAGRIRDQLKRLDDVIALSYDEIRRAHGEGYPESAIQDALKELALAKQSALRGDVYHTERLILSALRRVNRSIELPKMTRRRGVKFLANAAPLTAKQRAEMLATPEGRAELRRLREAAQAEAKEIESEISEGEKKRAEQRFAMLAGEAVKMAESRESQRAAERAAELAAAFVPVTKLKGGTIVGEGEKARRAPATAGQRGAAKIRTKGGGYKAVAEAARIVATAEEFGGGVRGAEYLTQFGARRTTKYPTVRPLYGELIKGGSRAYKLVQQFVPGGEIIKQAKGESITDFKRRALDAGFTPLGPDEPAEGEKAKPRIAISPMGWRLLTVRTVEDPDIFEEPRALRRTRVPVSRLAPPEIVGVGPSVEGWRTVMSASKRPADWKNVAYSVQRGDVPVLALPALLRRAEDQGAPEWALREIRGAIAYYRKHPEPLMSRYPSGATPSRRPIVGYETVDPSEAYTAADQERLGFEIGFKEGQIMDPSSATALVIQQRKMSRREDPYGWGYQRGVRRAMMERRWSARPFEPRASAKAEKYKSYPRGYSMSPEAYEGEVRRGVLAVPSRGTEGDESFVPSTVVFKNNRRRRAKRSRRAG